jgi:hypothetical protein
VFIKKIESEGNTLYKYLHITKDINDKYKYIHKKKYKVNGFPRFSLTYPKPVFLFLPFIIDSNLFCQPKKN